MKDIWRLSAQELAGLIKSKKVSAKEAAVSALARFVVVYFALNAVVDHRPEDVLAQAAEVDTAIARGHDVGVLAGVPVTVKANIDQAGYANTNGLKLQRDVIAKDNSPVVGGRRGAGAGGRGRAGGPAGAERGGATDRI